MVSIFVILLATLKSVGAVEIYNLNGSVRSECLIYQQMKRSTKLLTKLFYEEGWDSWAELN